jgi:hypothetical protein
MDGTTATAAPAAPATLNAALDELILAVQAALNQTPTINDGETASKTETWSISQIQAAIAAAVTGSNPAALGALQAAVAALQAKAGSDEGNLSALAGVAIRADAPQAFTPAQQAQALQNLGLSGAEFFVVEDLAGKFHAGLTNPTMQAAIQTAFASTNATS